MYVSFLFEAMLFFMHFTLLIVCHPSLFMFKFSSHFLSLSARYYILFFGYTCFVDLASLDHEKLFPHSIKCIFLGYCCLLKGYCCYYFETCFAFTHFFPSRSSSPEYLHKELLFSTPLSLPTPLVGLPLPSTFVDSLVEAPSFGVYI